MESLASIARYYSTDMDADHGHGDKGTWHSYIPIYELLFSGLRQRVVSVLEVGVAEGLSLLMWDDYFQRGTIHGMDIRMPSDNPLASIGLHVWECDSTDEHAVMRLGGCQYDIIIDDGDHAIRSQLATWANLRPRLNPGGIYVVEDAEDIDHDYDEFRRRGLHVLDLRPIKGRHDDVLCVYRSEEK